MAKAKKKKISTDLSSSMRETIAKTKGVEILSLRDDTTPLVVPDVLSTGLPNLDKILCLSERGQWGLPVGRIISIKSKPSVGKTTLLLRIADQAVKRGGAAHIIESERALDLKYARKVCSSVDNFFITQPDTLEEAFDTIQIALQMCQKARLVNKNTAPFVIIMDSFSGFPPLAEAEGDFSKSGKALGEHARIASMACRKLTGPLAKAGAILILSHQTKSKIGVYWGSTETNIGGDALNYHDSICLNLYRTTAIKDSKKRIMGHHGIIRTTKNKLHLPFREAKFMMVNGKGFSKNFAILDFLIGKRCVIKKGGWFHFKEDKELKWQGFDSFVEFVKSSKKAKRLIKESL